MNRIPAFDGIRAVAILMIVLCHICYGLGLMPIGHYLGSTFNYVFFIMSALLLGLKVNKNEHKEYKSCLYLTYIIHSGFISGYQNRYGDNLKPPTNVYHRMTA